MARWYSWIVLAACAVITQSLPHPDEQAYLIPDIPADKRAQYYVLHDDGDFKYGYDTGVGAYESAVKMGSGDLTGFFGFNNALGENVRVDYTAGAGGFQPRLNNLPVAPEAAAVRSVAISGPALVSGHSGFVTKYSGNQLSPTFSDQRRTAETSNIRSHKNIDGSYSFSYENSDSSRRESGDSDNNVEGQFSFVADDGQNRQIRYRAGSDTGFVVEGDGIPEAPAVPSFLSAVAPASGDINVASVPGYTYSEPTQSAVPTLYAGVPRSSSAPTQEEPRGDASYSFSYKTDDSAREESADPDLNVKGSYSFVGDDGETRRVDYIAGSGTGFVAKGDHLPVSPEDGDGTPLAAPIQYAAPARFSPVSLTRSQTSGSQASGDASYQFSYQTGDSSRSETADADLNVKGDFSFVADDGQRRTVSYIAGYGTGFVAEGSHLPVPPEVPAVSVTAAKPGRTAQPVSYRAPAVSYQIGIPSVVSGSDEPRRDGSYSFSYQTSDSSRAESSDSDLNVRGQYSFTGDDGEVRTVKYKAGSGTGFVAEGDHLPSDVPISPSTSVANVYSGATSGGGFQDVHQSGVKSSGFLLKAGQSESQIGANIAHTRNSDGSYSFSYQTPDSSRSESADSENNVVGEYNFVADDGQNRNIRYRAGATTGFVADGSSIPSAPEFKAAPYTPKTKLRTVPILTEYSASSSLSEPRGDASYSFNYNTDESSRNEESDRDLNVKGSFSFIADDGINRQVNYIAGSGTGFVAEGDHLPKPQEVSGGETLAGRSQVLVKGAQAGHFGSPVVATVKSHSLNQEIDNIRSTSNTGGGYSFSYTNLDSSRSESGDANNNVVGKYSFVADDGQNRQVRYRAGASTGYVAEGDGIPEISDISAAPVVDKTASVVPKARGYAYSAPAIPAVSTLYGAPSLSAADRAGAKYDHDTKIRNDASYSFKYDAGDSDREESADRDLNIRGQYSFVADDGIRRNVNYRAGSSSGFVAEGDHLPVAPETSPAVHAPSTRTASSALRSETSGSGYTRDSSGHSSDSGRTSKVRSGISSAASRSSGQVIGNVLLHQYPVGHSKFGYAFSEI